MKDSQSEIKIYLPLLASASLICLIFVFFTKNLLEVFKEEEAKIKKIKEDIEILVKKEEILNNYSDYELDEKIKMLNFILPKEKNVENLIYTLEKLAEENNIELAKLDFSPGFIKEISEDNFQVNVGFDGSFEDVKKFLEDFNKAPITVEVKAFKLNLLGKEATISASSADLSLSNYFKPFSIEVETLNQPLSPLTEKERVFLSQLNLGFFPQEEEFNANIPPSSENRSPF